MARKAVKYRNRQESILLLAVLRMWRARGRGRLMDRARNTQRLQGAWEAWKLRLSEIRVLDGK